MFMMCLAEIMSEKYETWILGTCFDLVCIHIYSLFTSLEETKVMIGVYIIIGLSFAPNAFEYYKVISIIHDANCVIKLW